MNTTATAEPNVQDLESQIRGIATRRGKQEGEFARFSERLLRIDAQEHELKVKLAGGDKGASSALDLLDSERKDISRNLDGLRTSIAELEGKQATLQGELNALVRTLAEEAEKRALEEWRVELSAAVERLYSGYSELSKLLGELRMVSQAGLDRFGTAGATAVELIMAKRLRNPLVDLLNAGWREPQVETYRKDFEVCGILPPGHPGHPLTPKRRA